MAMRGIGSRVSKVDEDTKVEGRIIIIPVVLFTARYAREAINSSMIRHHHTYQRCNGTLWSIPHLTLPLRRRIRYRAYSFIIFNINIDNLFSHVK